MAGGEDRGLAAVVAGGVAAVLASACCLLPLALVSVGVGGAWLGNLSALEPWRPVFIAAGLLALFFAYRRIFRSRAQCGPAGDCAMPVGRAAAMAFWGAAVLMLVAIVFPYVIPAFY